MKKIWCALLLFGLLMLFTGCSVENTNDHQLEIKAVNTVKVLTETQAIKIVDDTTPTLTLTETQIDVRDSVPSSTPTPFAADRRTPTPTAYRTPTVDTRPDPRDWRNWSITPTVSARALEIYQNGISIGSDPRAFSIIGDCQSEPPVFLGIYATNRYILREEEKYLEETIAYFAGHFNREHVTVKNGLSVASVFSPLWSPKEICMDGETPIACEFRLNRPSIVFVNLGTNWKNGDGYSHEIRLKEIVDFVIEHGALPILSTKGDNQEGDQSINFTTVRLAYEYDIPLWNFWAAIQYLPNHGIDQDRKDANYLTVDAWNERSYTGLRVLDSVWRSVTGHETP
jgi:hypothetical protein